MTLKLNKDTEPEFIFSPVPVQGSNGKWGYKLGKIYGDKLEEVQSAWIIEPKYDKAWSFDPDLHIAQVKVDEEKSYIEYDPVNNDVIQREELGPKEEYPTDHDGVTYSGDNFIQTTKGAETYLSSCGIPRTKDFFHQIFKDAWFDYNDVSDILAKVIYDRSPNWGKTRDKTMNDIIAETEVWLITEDEIGTSIEVKNRFTGKEKERLTIPKDLGGSPVNKKDQDRIRTIKELLEERDSLRKQPNEQRSKKIEEALLNLYKELWGEDERSHTDWIGCYIFRTGTILIKIDRIDEEARLFGCTSDRLFEKVLLHEFIHAALDLYPRDADGNKISYHDEEWKTKDLVGESFNEESIDNAIVLKLYKGTPGYRDVKGFIETQPYYYRRAVELDKSKLLFLLRDLIAYKISAPVSTILSTAKGGQYTYYVNGKLIVAWAGIGVAAYEVFKKIISTLSLTDVLEKYGGPQFGSLPLVIDANSYKYSPNQTKYYKVPVRTKDGKDIYLCSQWYDRHYNLLQDVVSAYPGLFPGGINRLP